MGRLLTCVLLSFGLLIGSVSAAELKIVQESDFVEAISQEYIERVGDDDIELEFFGGQTNFTIENANNYKIMINSSKFDELQNKFSVTAEIFADGKPFAKTDLQGKYYVMGDVYVPNRNIDKGEIIEEDMLRSIKVRMNRIKHVNLVDKEKLIDKEAKRNLKEGKVVNDKDVGQPVLIKKGQIVNSVFKTDNMLITAQVEAMSDGVKGQRIEVRNTKSKKDIYAEVIDADTVLVEMQ